MSFLFMKFMQTFIKLVIYELDSQCLNDTLMDPMWNMYTILLIISIKSLSYLMEVVKECEALELLYCGPQAKKMRAFFGSYWIFLSWYHSHSLTFHFEHGHFTPCSNLLRAWRLVKHIGWASKEFLSNLILKFLKQFKFELYCKRVLVQLGEPIWLLKSESYSDRWPLEGGNHCIQAYLSYNQHKTLEVV